ncbi:hypothetical protein MHPYR_340031 [uncultured Mycobacterium sp.]|uniref:Uncharacterized protein n=1 Tax=uncultured Mycobacterium sp. TaxID=171292 RepID=A0A1Y5PD70_9MYCO|nr:hypothetical protein MHPYR_340031 [uncultured Mycobacterium sp.]
MSTSGTTAADGATHVCRAKGCPVEVAAADFMCQPHWLLVPAPLREAIKTSYQTGHEHDPAPELSAIAQAAVDAVAHQESRSAPRAPRPRRGKPVQLALFDLAEPIPSSSSADTATLTRSDRRSASPAAADRRR